MTDEIAAAEATAGESIPAETNGEALLDASPAPDGNWLSGLSDPDLRNNPTLGKYKSAEEAHKGHLKLQESFGMDKVVWPKDANDTERWGVINKKLGVPEKPDGYALEAFSNPEGVQLFDKLKFQEMMHEVSAPKSLAEKLWSNYTESTKKGYLEAQQQFDAKVEASKNELTQEWGEAYETKVNRGQAVIDSFAKSQEQKDFLTATLAQDANGLRWLADLGDQFAESSIAGFQEKKGFTLTPSEAREELDRIKNSAEYRSDSERVRQPLIDRSNELMRLINAGRA